MISNDDGSFHFQCISYVDETSSLSHDLDRLHLYSETSAASASPSSEDATLAECHHDTTYHQQKQQQDSHLSTESFPVVSAANKLLPIKSKGCTPSESHLISNKITFLLEKLEHRMIDGEDRTKIYPDALYKKLLRGLRLTVRTDIK